MRRRSPNPGGLGNDVNIPVNVMGVVLTWPPAVRGVTLTSRLTSSTCVNRTINVMRRRSPNPGGLGNDVNIPVNVMGVVLTWPPAVRGVTLTSRLTSTENSPVSASSPPATAAHSLQNSHLSPKKSFHLRTDDLLQVILNETNPTIRSCESRKSSSFWHNSCGFLGSGVVACLGSGTRSGRQHHWSGSLCFVGRGSVASTSLAFRQPFCYYVRS